MSYLKQEFMDHLHNNNYANPGVYCNALDNVEKFFGVSIDEEYDRDQCEALYNIIQETRKNPEQIGKNEHDVRTYASRLKKYIEFRQKQDSSNTNFTWIPFYEEFADKLLPYKEDRLALISLIKKVYSDLGMKLPKLDYEEPVDIDPFTVVGLFNKGITEANRIKIIKGFKKLLDISADVPADFSGIPVVNNLSATFYYFVGDREEHDIDNLWELFDSALQYSATNSEEDKEKVITAYDKVTKQHGASWNITMGLYWIRPDCYVSLDSRSREYLMNFNPPVGGAVVSSNKLPDGKKYFWNIEQLKKSFLVGEPSISTFYELSYAAFVYAGNKNTNKKIRYWIYSPGEQAFNWNRDVETGTMAIGWDFLGDLSQYDTKEGVLTAIRNQYGDTGSHKNDVTAVWQFANEIKVGDIIFAKRGISTIIGKGVVVGDYFYDSALAVYKNIISVDWTNVGEWEHPGPAVVKTLTDITPYEDYVQNLLNLFAANEITVKATDEYTKADFLNDVYIDEAKYETCVSRLKHKKNLILQGAPGVGKTFAARRLAWSIMGVKDDSRVEFVQFHQSYSYEDFIMGYKPVENGFKLEEGIFYAFCDKARKDSANDYFFIIDEINRGNMSKIFGELLMLIESDYREKDIKLAYNKKPFSIPKNLYIIGMMNTADRSLAMIDYALRRRFSFVEMTPGFDSEGFKKYQADVNSTAFDKLIGRIKALNSDIENDASLGKGFCIGHSYFCNLETNCNSRVLKEIVEYDIVPMLEEYWFDDKEKADRWSDDLRGIINE